MSSPPGSSTPVSSQPPISALQASLLPQTTPPATPNATNTSPAPNSPTTFPSLGVPQSLTTSTSTGTGTTTISSSSAPSGSSITSPSVTSSVTMTSTRSNNTASTVVQTSTSTSQQSSLQVNTSLVSATPVVSTNSVRVSAPETSFVTSTSTLPPASASLSASNSNKSFFQNTGAVAGTFTAVGLVVLALVFLTTYIIRRRRQAKFDREVDEATFEAANTSAPVFLDSDVEERGGGGKVYSDTSSHGTYAQPPMSTEYGMREVGSGVAGIGVGMGGGYGGRYDYDLYAPAAGYAHGNGHGHVQQGQGYTDYAQYNANANANPYADPVPASYNPSNPVLAPAHSRAHSTSEDGHSHVQVHGQGQRQTYDSPRSPELQLLEAAGLDTGLDSGVGAGVGRIQHGMSLSHEHEDNEPLQNPYDPAQGSYSYPQTQPQAQMQRGAGGEDDAYGGYVDDHSHGGEHEHAGDETGSYYEAEKPRVLKIANM